MRKTNLQRGIHRTYLVQFEGLSVPIEVGGCTSAEVRASCVKERHGLFKSYGKIEWIRLKREQETK